MPSSSRFKCHFGCEIDGPLHRFPKPKYPHLTKFNLWKSVLYKDVQDKGDIYIYNQIRICNCHFEIFLLFTKSQTYLQLMQFLHKILPLTSTQTTKVHQSTHSFPNVTISMPSTSRNIDVTKKAGTNVAKQGAIKGCLTINENQANKEVAKLKQRLLKLSLKYKSQSLKIYAAEKLSKSKSFLKVIEKMPDDIKTLTSLQLKWKTKARGRRYTLEEKIMALSIYKQSQKAYNLMNKMFVLPSKRSLQKLLSGS